MSPASYLVLGGVIAVGAFFLGFLAGEAYASRRQLALMKSLLRSTESRRAN